jgi:hypothetical protein
VTNQDIKTLPANISGVFYTNGIFSTGTNNPNPDSQLKVDGTVVGIGGVSLQRNNKGLYPAEYFNFRPDFLVTLTQVGLRQKIIQELIVN